MDKRHDYPFKLYTNPNVIKLMIEIKNLYKSFGDTQILFDVYNHSDSPYNNGQPVISVGVGFGL